MKELLSSIQTIKEYNSKDINEVAKEFSEYSKQDISEAAIQNFKLTGLNNVDFLTSDYLNYYGIKNILQHEQV